MRDKGPARWYSDDNTVHYNAFGRRLEVGKLKVDLETRKRAVAELSRLKGDMAARGTVTASEAAQLRRALAQKDEELSRMRRASTAEPVLAAAPSPRSETGAPTLKAGLVCASLLQAASQLHIRLILIW